MGGTPLRSKSAFDPSTAPRPVLIGMPPPPQANSPMVVVHPTYADPNAAKVVSYANVPPAAELKSAMPGPVYGVQPTSPGPVYGVQPIAPGPVYGVQPTAPGPVYGVQPTVPVVATEVVAVPHTGPAMTPEQLVAAGYAPRPGEIHHPGNVQTQHYQQPTLEHQQMLEMYNNTSMTAAFFRGIDNTRIP